MTSRSTYDYQYKVSPALAKIELLRTKALKKLLWPVRRYIIAGCTLAMLGSALGMVPYIAIAEIARLIFDHIKAPEKDIWLWVGTGIVGVFVRLALIYLSSMVGHVADADILHDIRVRIVRKLGTIKLGWFREKGSGAIEKVMTTDLEEMHQLIAHSLREIISAVTSIIVGITYLWLINWQMTLISITVLLIMYVSYRIAMRSVTTHMNRLLLAEGKISTSAVEYADGIAVVKTFSAGGRLLSRFNDAVKEYEYTMGIWVAETMYSSAFSRLFASEVTLLAVLTSAGLYFISKGSLLVVDFLPFLIVGIGLPTSLVPAVHGSQGLRKGRLSASNIESILSQQVISETTDPLEPSEYGVAFEKVCFNYSDGHDVIHDISFECPQGTVTALVGRSGSGKSTLAHLLPRFYDVRKGKISIGGIDIRKMTSRKLLSSMSLVFQDIVLLKDTIRENIRIANSNATDEMIIKVAKAAHIHDVILKFPQGYDTKLGMGDSGLSGGEQQRLTIARALLSNAPIVVLDEATASLDPDNEVLVQQALTVLIKNKTVIMIAHRLYTVSSAHQIIVLNEGRILEKGNHQQLLSNGSLYAKMWKAQTI